MGEDRVVGGALMGGGLDIEEDLEGGGGGSEGQQDDLDDILVAPPHVKRGDEGDQRQERWG